MDLKKMMADIQLQNRKVSYEELKEGREKLKHMRLLYMNGELKELEAEADRMYENRVFYTNLG